MIFINSKQRRVFSAIVWLGCLCQMLPRVTAQIGRNRLHLNAGVVAAIQSAFGPDRHEQYRVPGNQCDLLGNDADRISGSTVTVAGQFPVARYFSFRALRRGFLCISNNRSAGLADQSRSGAK